jgi:murein DD-endopeptidase MepM/ murein hydrolase activator NlpD
MIKRFKLPIMLICTLLMTFSVVSGQDNDDSAFRPFASTVVTLDDVTLELYFDEILQGRVGLLHVSGAEVAGARVLFMNKENDFFPIENDGYYGLLTIGMNQTPRTYDFSVLVWKTDGTRVTVPAQVRVVLGGFIRQDFSVSADRAYLIDPQIERTEFARLDSIVGQFTTERLWGNDGFQNPMDSELTSPFGAFRIFNETVETRHTGWDFRAPVGSPVASMADGRVAFAGLLDIRGNHVIIDHGYGVFSTYSHFSQTHVTNGQTVTRGQILGVSGNSGRSTGPHLHWEVVVNGYWVDSADFLAMWLPRERED